MYVQIRAKRENKTMEKLALLSIIMLSVTKPGGVYRNILSSKRFAMSMLTLTTFSPINKIGIKKNDKNKRSRAIFVILLNQPLLKNRNKYSTVTTTKLQNTSINIMNERKIIAERLKDERFE